MAIVVTESWKGSGLTKAFFDADWTATRVFQVTGATSKTQAIENCANTTSNGTPGAQPGSSHPENARLICGPLACDDNLVLRTVTATYKISPNGDPNPLNAPTRWRWRPGNITEASDADVYGNPYVNSAFVPFEDDDRVRGTLFVSAIRNEPYYDVRKAMAYQNRTNTDNFVIKGAGSPTVFVSPGQAMCLSVEEQEDFYYGLPFAAVTYNFELREGDLLPVGGATEYDGFFNSKLDQGTSGWYVNDDGTRDRGRFCNANKVELDGPALLDGSGVPIDDTIRVIKSVDSSGTIAADAAPCLRVLPDTVYQKQVGDVWYLLYRRWKQAAFSALNL